MAKRLLSGVKPSGRPHIGNYLGAMSQFVELARTHEAYVFIADYHAMNTVHDGPQLRQNSLDVALDYLAIGLDPAEVVLFKQSDLPEHTELCWIFNTLTTMPYLMRAHAFKDAEAKNKDINVGTFDYPMLMTADILLYEPDIVPVGADQKQHVEIARDTAEKFNRTYGETFKLPEAHIPHDVAIIPGIDEIGKLHNGIPGCSNDVAPHKPGRCGVDHLRVCHRPVGILPLPIELLTTVWRQMLLPISKLAGVERKRRCPASIRFRR